MSFFPSRIDYAILGPLEHGKPVLHNSQVQLAVDRLLAEYVCGGRLCGGMLGSPLEMIGGKTHIRLRCMKNPKHKGIRKPRMSPKPYGI